MRKKKTGVKEWLDRIFTKKQRRISAKQRQKIRRELITEMIRERKEMIIDGQHYEAAVEKFMEDMTENIVAQKIGAEKSLDDAAVEKAIAHYKVPVIRCSKVPELLLLLGVRIRA